jgi:hypothetical protein
MKNNKNFNNKSESFVYYLSHLDSGGLFSILKDDHEYDEQSKQDWIIFFEKQFESFKRNNISYLKPIVGVCTGCKKGCSGYTFLDKVNGFYVDLAIESNGAIIVDFTDCVNLKNKILGLNKKEQIFMNDKDLHGTTQEFPF